MNVQLGGDNDVTATIADVMINRAIQQLSFDAPAVEKQDTIIGATGATGKYYSLPTDFISINSRISVLGVSLSNSFITI